MAEVAGRDNGRRTIRRPLRRCESIRSYLRFRSNDGAARVRATADRRSVDFDTCGVAAPLWNCVTNKSLARAAESACRTKSTSCSNCIDRLINAIAADLQIERYD